MTAPRIGWLVSSILTTLVGGLTAALFASMGVALGGLATEPADDPYAVTIGLLMFAMALVALIALALVWLGFLHRKAIYWTIGIVLTIIPLIVLFNVFQGPQTA